MTARLTHPREKKDSKKKEQLLTCCREKKVSLLEIPDFSSNQTVFLYEGEGGWGRGEGNVASGCERMCEGVHSSLHKPPASSAEEIILNRYASKSAITSGKFLLISMSLLFPMPMVQFGGLPRITTFFPEFF